MPQVPALAGTSGHSFALRHMVPLTFAPALATPMRASLFASGCHAAIATCFSHLPFCLTSLRHAVSAAVHLFFRITCRDCVFCTRQLVHASPKSSVWVLRARGGVCFVCVVWCVLTRPLLYATPLCATQRTTPLRLTSFPQVSSHGTMQCASRRTNGVPAH